MQRANKLGDVKQAYRSEFSGNSCASDTHAVVMSSQQPAAVSLSLSKMVDLALGRPELGAVINFNVLHSLLHAMLQRLDISDVLTDLPIDLAQEHAVITEPTHRAAR